MSKYKILDLCAGIGGISRGFEMTNRFKTVLAAEIDPHAAETYKHLYGIDPLNDLTTETFKKKVAATKYDILLAGFPCQTFSSVGKKLGFLDEVKGTVFFDIAEIIGQTRPKAVFLENVSNLVTHNGGATMKTIIVTLEDTLGYRVIGVTNDEKGNHYYERSDFLRNTKDFGLPQNRPRIYIMAFNKEYYGAAVNALPSSLPRKGKTQIFADITSLLERDVDPKYYLAQGYLNTLKRHKKEQGAKGYGFGFCVLNAKEENRRVSNAILATGGSGKERNLIYQPKQGVAGKQLPHRKTPLNDEGIRMMTPKEWGRLQGFIGYAFVGKNGKDAFSFPEGTAECQKYKQFGNAVSIPVIKTMAEFMLQCFSVMGK